MIDVSDMVKYKEDYVVVARVDERRDKYALFLSEDIEIGDVVQFRPDYSGGGPWSFDSPIQVDAVRRRDGKVIAQMRTLGIDLNFSLDPKCDSCSYRIAVPEVAAALLEGVPVEDVFA